MDAIESSVSKMTGSYRILYTPRSSWSSPYLFLGLNPAGVETDPADASVETGNAYLTERWGAGGTYNPLQKQVKAFFDGSSAAAAGRGAADDWCVSNLVFYRSPSWDTMAKKKAHVELCHGIWRERFATDAPRVIVTNGYSVYAEVQKLLTAVGFAVAEETLAPTMWDGAHTCKMTRGAQSVTLVGYPHLSRFGVVTREKNAASNAAVFDKIAAAM
jgi:hypothetical protein